MFKLKKLLSATLSTLLLISTSTSVLAVEQESDTQNLVEVKAAYIKDVDEFGRSLSSDKDDNNLYNLDISDAFSIKQKGNKIEVNGSIDGQDFSVSGNAYAKSENENVIYYDTNSSKSNFESVNLTFESDISKSAIYFKDFHKNNPEYTSMLKLYLKPKNSKNKDYILIEAFGYQLNDIDSVKNSISKDEAPLSWVVNEFKPDPNKSTITPFVISQNEYTETQTFNNISHDETHTLKYRVHLDTSDITKGGDGTQKARLTIIDKTIRAASAPNYNSDNSSALHITGLSIRATSSPNTAFFSEQIAGIVSGSSASLDASIGISTGALGLSYGVPVSFTGSSSISLSDTFKSFENGVNGKYTRHNKTTMGSKYRLTKEKDYFEVLLTTRDYGKVASTGSFQVKFDLTITNASTRTETKPSKSLSGTVNIK